MPTERPACREADSAGSNFGVEAPWIEPASRNKSEPESASLRSVRSANLSEMPKPAIRREATFTRSGGDLRGRWGQRAGKVWLGIYLHWFDHVFHAKNGPAQRVRAALVRYADDFVVLARSAGPDLREFIEKKIEGWLGLRINREKTRVVNLREQSAVLEFLGDSFRLDRDRHGRKMRYWNMQPSEKALARERENLRGLINHRRCFQPLPELIGELNRHLRGWANYFRAGYSRDAFREINAHVRQRLERHLRRRSQRGWRPAKGTSVHAHLQHLGLIYL